MTPDFDLIVVGAGPAGSMAAYTAATAGLRVLLLDKSNFPRMKPCGGGLTIKALNLLPFSISEILQSATGTLLMGYKYNPPIRYETRGFICGFVVREVFDNFLYGKAQEAGAQFQKITSLDHIQPDDHGVCVQVDGGTELRATYLVAADGANSQCRRLLNPRVEFSRGFALEGIVPYDALSGIPDMEFDFGCVDYGYGWIFPKKGHANVGIYTCNPDVKLSKDLLRTYLQTKLGTDRIDNVVGFPLGFGGQTYSQGHDRVLFAGDAVGMAEPLLGEGLHNALKTGISAGESVARAITENIPIGTAYSAKIGSVKSDILRCRNLAFNFFYPRLDTSARNIMKFPLVESVLMRGFSAGLTLSATMNQFPIVPFKSPVVPNSLSKIQNQNRKPDSKHVKSQKLVIAD